MRQSTHEHHNQHGVRSSQFEVEPIAGQVAPPSGKGSIMSGVSLGELQQLQQVCTSLERGDLRERARSLRGEVEWGLTLCKLSEQLNEGQLDLAARVRTSKFGSQPPSSYREWAKQARFLQQRGFTAEQIGSFDGS